MRWMVYDVRLRDIDAIAEEAGRRLAVLEAGGMAESLPACPEWMSKFCRFAPGCGCGDA